MENTLFYTFSTIAQTLAAAIALLGALVLFRLQRIPEALELGMTQLRQPYSFTTDVQLALEEERYADVLAYLAITEPDNPAMAASAAHQGRKVRVQGLLVLQKELQWWLRISLAITVVVIGASVTAITLVTYIVCSPMATTLTLGLGLAAFVGCLIVYAFLARKTVQ